MIPTITQRNMKQTSKSEMKHKRKYWLPVIPAAIFAVMIFLYHERYIMPLWAPFNEKEGDYSIADETGGVREDHDYHIELKDKRLVVSEVTAGIYQDGEEAKIFRFDENCRVEDYLVGDIDHDGKDELIVLFMRRGSFGPYRPFWVDKDETCYSQHIGIYEFGYGNHKKINDRYIAHQNGSEKGADIIKSKWVSSRVGMDITGFELDEKQILTVYERGGSFSRWYMGDFGLILMED